MSCEAPPLRTYCASLERAKRSRDCKITLIELFYRAYSKALVTDILAIVMNLAQLKSICSVLPPVVNMDLFGTHQSGDLCIWMSLGGLASALNISCSAPRYKWWGYKWCSSEEFCKLCEFGVCILASFRWKGNLPMAYHENKKSNWTKQEHVWTPRDTHKLLMQNIYTSLWMVESSNMSSEDHRRMATDPSCVATSSGSFVGSVNIDTWCHQELATHQPSKDQQKNDGTVAVGVNFREGWLTSIQPKNQGLGWRIVWRLGKEVEKSPSCIGIHGN